jgi:hypothetical protein
MSQGNVSYPLSLGSIPTQYWPLMLQIFQQRGIDPSNIPDFTAPPSPQGPGLPAWQRSNPVYQVDQQSPAALSQAGLALAQLGQPTQPTWMAQQQPQQQAPQGLLSPQGLLTTPQISANTTDLQYLRGLLNP